MWQQYFEHYARTVFPALIRQREWNYKDDLTVMGLYALYGATGNTLYKDTILNCVPFLLEEDGSLKNWNEEVYNLDLVSKGRTLLVLYHLTGDKQYLKPAWQIRENLEGHPRTNGYNYWHKDIYPDQVWLDGTYMALPFLAAFDSSQEDWSDIFNQLGNIKDIMRIPENGLYLHGFDESRSAYWANPHTGLSQSVWLRGEGWLLMAICDICAVASGHPVDPIAVGENTGGNFYLARTWMEKDLLENAVEGIMAYQDPKTKMFYQVVDHPKAEGNYLETSGSAMVAYALLKGTQLGIFDKAREGAEILDGIERTCLIQGNPPILTHICASAGLGYGPDNRTDRDGSLAYYLSERCEDDNQHGSAACMLAMAALMRFRAKNH